jgi:hypothetical protein
MSIEVGFTAQTDLGLEDEWTQGYEDNHLTGEHGTICFRQSEP